MESKVYKDKLDKALTLYEQTYGEEKYVIPLCVGCKLGLERDLDKVINSYLNKVVVEIYLLDQLQCMICGS